MKGVGLLLCPPPLRSANDFVPKRPLPCHSPIRAADFRFVSLPPPGTNKTTAAHTFALRPRRPPPLAGGPRYALSQFLPSLLSLAPDNVLRQEAEQLIRSPPGFSLTPRGGGAGFDGGCSQQGRGPEHLLLGFGPSPGGHPEDPSGKKSPQRFVLFISRRFRVLFPLCLALFTESPLHSQLLI